MSNVRGRFAPPSSFDARKKLPIGKAKVAKEMERGRREDREDLDDSAMGVGYLVSLGTIARELAAAAHIRGTYVTTTVRILRERLVQWVEDVRSVGGYDVLASTVEELARRLASASSGEISAIAAELATLANGATPPPKPASRGAFWK